MIDAEWLASRLAALKEGAREAFYARMAPADRERLMRDFDVWAQRSQRPPRGDWRVWLIMAGRGFGKTRAGAEWVTRKAGRFCSSRIALVGATMDEARGVMVEGESGLLACADKARPPKWEPSLKRLVYPGGAIVQLYSAEAPEGLRGPQHQYAWCDELGKWPDAEAVWSNLMFGLRQGRSQQVLVTTTPRASTLLTSLRDDPATVVTRGRTAQNAHLSPAFLEFVTKRYGGTRLGRQELDGELIEEIEGAIWTRDMIEACRVEGDVAGGDLARVVIGVDPSASATGDSCGIVACGLTGSGDAVVLEDATVDSAKAERWAAAVVACAGRWQADRIVAEANNGGDMVRSVLHAHDRALPVRLVHASRGKSARAEPVAYLYTQGRVRHAQPFPELEDQLCGMTRGGGYEGPGRSPDRADALVWALTELVLNQVAQPRIRVL